MGEWPNIINSRDSDFSRRTSCFRLQKYLYRSILNGTNYHGNCCSWGTTDWLRNVFEFKLDFYWWVRFRQLHATVTVVASLGVQYTIKLLQFVSTFISRCKATDTCTNLNSNVFQNLSTSPAPNVNLPSSTYEYFYLLSMLIGIKISLNQNNNFRLGLNGI